MEVPFEKIKPHSSRIKYLCQLLHYLFLLLVTEFHCGNEKHDAQKATNAKSKPKQKIKTLSARFLKK